MNLKVKVCGLRDPGNIRELVVAGVDYIGFIFYKKSPRYAADELAPGMVDDIPPGIKKIGVFVNEDSDRVIATSRRYGLDGIQLHGNETIEQCRRIRNSGFWVIKALHIGEKTDFSHAKSFLADVDYFLFDTNTPFFGGSGIAFDWGVLGEYGLSKPFFLSGGIGIEMAEKIRALNIPQLHAVDINSRFEISPGLKDIQMIKSFTERLKK